MQCENCVDKNKCPAAIKEIMKAVDGLKKLGAANHGIAFGMLVQEGVIPEVIEDMNWRCRPSG